MFSGIKRFWRDLFGVDKGQEMARPGLLGEPTKGTAGSTLFVSTLHPADAQAVADAANALAGNSPSRTDRERIFDGLPVGEPGLTAAEAAAACGIARGTTVNLLSLMFRGVGPSPGPMGRSETNPRRYWRV